MAIGLGPGPIGTIPQGLLGLLQLKELGVNPNTLQLQVQPQIDVGPLYLQRQMQDTAGLFGGTPTTASIATAGHGNVGFSASVPAVVPQTEMWWVEQAALTVSGNTIAAGDSITAGIGMFNLTFQTLVTPVFADVVTARARSWTTPPIVRPFFAGPGTTFFAFVVDVVTVGGITLFLAMKAVRIPI